MSDDTKATLRDKRGNVIAELAGQIETSPPGLLFSSSDVVALKQLGLSNSITAPCGGTIPTCAVADGKTLCGCGHIHPPQFYSVNLPAIFQELADVRERLKSLEVACAARATLANEFINGAAAVLSDLITCYDQPTMATNIIKGLGLEVVDFQDCGDDYKVIRSATNG
jgi:hypothetical protein